MDAYPARIANQVRSAARCWGIRSTVDVVITVVWLLFAVFLLWPLLRWVTIDAVWFGPPSLCRPRGACWPYIAANLDNLLFGPLPRTAIPRMYMLLLLILIGLVLLAKNHRKLWVWLAICCLQPISVWLILHGGYFGLEVVSTQYWGGYTLNLLVSIMSIAMAFPLAVVLGL